MKTFRFVVLSAALLSPCAAASAQFGSGGGACPGDTNGDGAVNFVDLNAVLSTFNHAVPPNTGGDVTGDGLVGFADLNLVISSFNVQCVYDARLVSLTRPDLIYAGQPFTLVATIRHNGDGPRAIPITLEVGGAFPVMHFPNVPPNVDHAVAFQFTAPAASTPCSDGDPFALRACLNWLFDPDGDTSNDCAAAPTTLAAAHWDIALEIIDSSPHAVPCGEISWTVRARNTGNVASQPTCIRTGTNCFPGAGPNQWGCTMGTALALIPVLEPGESVDFPYTLALPCWALVIQQWIKVEIATNTGCMELCPEGNFAEVPFEVFAAR
ncbi:MAG: hypothetical protein IBJ10_09085 [Phycisphaerales bacterium]|nr:hypothetical protein [Phycisphaerales bacterium]